MQEELAMGMSDRGMTYLMFFIMALVVYIVFWIAERFREVDEAMENWKRKQER